MIEIDSHPATSRAAAAIAHRGALRAAVLALVVVLAVACAPVAVRPTAPVADDAAMLAAQVARESLLASRADWSFSGRVALSQGKDGGSGRIDWTQRGDRFDIRLSAPITGKSWRLVGDAAQARLDGLDGGARDGVDAEALLQDATGWRIPVRAMQRWVRGARGEGPSELSFDAQGRPARLQQAGWTIDYRDWDAATPARPTRVFASRDGASVRLVIDRWTGP
jgi:outer membrane lipoprotein LolB